MSGFQSARIFLGIIHGIGWLVIAAAVWMAYVATQTFDPTGGLLISAAVAFCGLILVATAQIAMALIVTAENTTELLEEVRRLGNIASAASPAPSASARTPSAHPVPLPPTRSAPTPPATPGKLAVGDTIKVFRGRAIVRASDGVTVGARKFPNVLAAEKFIDGSDG